MLRSSFARAALVALLALNSGSLAARGIEQRRLAAEARRRAAVTVSPDLLLQKVYASYIMVGRCHEARRGELALPIDAGELARADAEAKSLSVRIKSLAPAVRDDVAWQRAREQVGPFSQNQQNCRAALSIIDDMYRDLAE